MIKCFLLAAQIVLCTEQNVDITCVNHEMSYYMEVARYTQGAVNLAVKECLLDASGCCSFHGGIDFYDQDERVWVCNDTSESATCRERRK